MSLSIYIKLRIAATFGKVKIKPKYKHLNYMMDNKFVNPTVNGSTTVGGWPRPTYSDWYTITSDGKKAMWQQGNLFITRRIAWLSLFVSTLVLVLNIYIYFKK